MSDELQFDTVEHSHAQTGLSCMACKRVVDGTYWEMGAENVAPTTLCDGCRPQLQLWFNLASSWRAHLRALVFGLGAGAAGFALYWGVLALTGYEVGLISIAVGWMVGMAVRKGGYNLGTHTKAAMAVAITYLSVTLAFAPLIYAQFAADATGLEAAASAIAAVVAAPLNPVLSLVEDPAGGFLGVLILGFGLWQAFSLNKKVAIAIRGPFRLSPTGGDVAVAPFA